MPARGRGFPRALIAHCVGGENNVEKGETGYAISYGAFSFFSFCFREG